MDNATQSNPLRNFRAPARIPKRHAPIVGNHFVTRREDVENDQSMLNVYPGDFTLIKNPGLELEFCLWEDLTESNNHDASMRASAQFFSLTMKKGYAEALAADFRISERIKLMWKADIGKRITLAGKKNSLVLMYRTGQKADEYFEIDTRRSTDVQTSFEEKVAGNAALASSVFGKEVTMESTFVDESESREMQEER